MTGIWHRPKTRLLAFKFCRRFSFLSANHLNVLNSNFPSSSFSTGMIARREFCSSSATEKWCGGPPGREMHEMKTSTDEPMGGPKLGIAISRYVTPSRASRFRHHSSRPQLSALPNDDGRARRFRSRNTTTDQKMGGLTDGNHAPRSFRPPHCNPTRPQQHISPPWSSVACPVVV